MAGYPIRATDYLDGHCPSHRLIGSDDGLQTRRSDCIDSVLFPQRRVIGAKALNVLFYVIRVFRFSVALREYRPAYFLG